MVNCNPKSTPPDSNARLSAAMVPKSEGEKKKKPSTKYRSVVSTLLYLSATTRPEISYSVSQVAKFCENPQPAHWNGVKRIHAYLKATCDYGLWLGGRDERVVGYTNADYAGDLDDSKSTSGNIFFYKGGPVSWGCSKQTCVALSTTESEYIAATKAAQTAIWLGLLETEV
ncbi:secreted RxLR effector protein 161-like [Daphnia pulex]|uniref:secreted RxLR effector protein 161-like n=1 Tax=Daphnia pulex TaxID=6669 RepID=UPI001EDEAECD|nr:secreted RxLR effector protein 161-like [Daphnia pulex]